VCPNQASCKQKALVLIILLKTHNAHNVFDGFNNLFELSSLFIVCVHTCLIVNSFTLTKNKWKLSCHFQYGFCQVWFPFRTPVDNSRMLRRGYIFKCVHNETMKTASDTSNKECYLLFKHNQSPNKICAYDRYMWIWIDSLNIKVQALNGIVWNSGITAVNSFLTYLYFSFIDFRNELCILFWVSINLLSLKVINCDKQYYIE